MIRGGALRFKAKGGQLLFALLAVLFLGQAAEAQTRFMYLTGQTLSPAFEGWWPNDDGSFTMFFGYMNSNWEARIQHPGRCRQSFHLYRARAPRRPRAGCLRPLCSRPGTADALLPTT